MIRDDLESRLSFSLTQISGLLAFWGHNGRGIIPRIGKIQDIVWASIIEGLIQYQRINIYLAEYSYYFPYC